MRLALLALFAALAPLAARAQSAPPRAADLVTWTARASRVTGGAEVVLSARIARGWRMYALESAAGRPLSVELTALPAGLRAGAPRQSRPRTGHDEGLDVDYTYFAETARVAVPLATTRGLARGRHPVSGTVRFALCDDRVCLPPAAVPFQTVLHVR